MLLSKPWAVVHSPILFYIAHMLHIGIVTTPLVEIGVLFSHSGKPCSHNVQYSRPLELGMIFIHALSLSLIVRKNKWSCNASQVHDSRSHRFPRTFQCDNWVLLMVNHIAKYVLLQHINQSWWNIEIFCNYIPIGKIASLGAE